MSRVAIVGALRTPIGKFLGSFKKLRAADLGVEAVRSLLERTGVAPDQVEEVIFGVGRQAGGGPNPARQVLVRSGIPESRIAYTVNMACGSGLLAIEQGADAIRHRGARMVVVGGAESMSRVPYFLERAREGYRLGSDELVDGMYRDGFQCPLADQLMGGTAENLAEEFAISREEQDQYAVTTQERCESARRANRFAAEIAPVTIPSRKGPIVVEHDEHPRDGVTLESMAKLAPVFKKDGSVHPGNSSGITDGAAALLLASEDAVRDLGLQPIGYVGPCTRAGVEPRRMGMGPVPAVRVLCEQTGRSLQDYELVELNEAFAAQVLACDRELQFDRERLNVNGGSIALGHPIGATGARIVVTLLHEMMRRDSQLGLATLCISGGLGLAMEIEGAGS